MDPSIKAYLNAEKALKQKYDEIKRGITIRKELLAEHYKPLTAPLREMNSRLKLTTTTATPSLPPPPPPLPSIEESDKPKSQTLGLIAQKYLSAHLERGKGTDTTFGVHYKKGKLAIGNISVAIEGDDIVLGDTGNVIKGTEGLWELMTKTHPDNYTPEDYKNYEKVVLLSNTFRFNDDPKSTRFKQSSGNKYNKIIKPILQMNGLIVTDKNTKRLSLVTAEAVRKSARIAAKTGSGLRKLETNTPVEYVYWNSLDELLERLYIVYGEMKSGNTNPNLFNEMVNILQEIKEI